MNPVFLAIDTADPARARALVAAVRPHIGGLKLGLEWFAANGPGPTGALAREFGLPLFLDLKLHDIPTTVAAAVRAVAPLEPALLTVHGAGGRAMLEAARAAAPAGTAVVAVTVLTSLDAADLEATGIAGSPAGQALRLARLAEAAGLAGLVASPLELAPLRRQWPAALLVVPGIRPEGAPAGDQKRTLAPREALEAGASCLVIGRPITAAPDPGAAAAAIAASLR
ncbi:orotidine-5'-phosphate decarboxylase [Thermaurantiacus sp.]